MAYTPQTQGPQKPEKYKFTGATYAYYGEQPGFVYDPYRDAYMPDKNDAQAYYQQAGVIDPPLPGGERKVGPDGRTYERDPNSPGGWKDVTPKAPGLLEQIAPLGAAALAVEGGKQLGVSLLSGGISLPSLGGAAAIGGAQATGAGTVLGGSQAVGAGAGLIGLTGASPFLGAAGLAAGAYTGYQQVKGLLNAGKGKDMSLLQETALAFPTFGLSYAWDPIKDAFGWGDQDRWKTEGNRLKKLQKNGTNIPQAYLDAMPTGGRSFDSMQRKDQAADFIGFDNKGAWVNNKFNQSRNVADLRGTDLIGYAAFAENDPTWFDKNQEERTRIAQAALDSGAVKERRGTIDVDWNKFTPPQAAPTPATPLPQNQGSPGMRPRKHQGRPKQPMQR